jgi:hypothetical protein
MRLSDSVVEAVRKSKVKVYFANRHTTKVWNQVRASGDPIQYGGWYWLREEKGRVVETDTEGPFRSESAAIRDAYMKLQLKHKFT